MFFFVIILASGTMNEMLHQVCPFYKHEHRPYSKRLTINSIFKNLFWDCP